MAGNVVVKVEDYGYIRGQDGASAYEQAVAGGYPGTEEQFAQDLINFTPLAAQAAASATAAQTAQGLAETAQGAAEAAQSAAEGYADSASSSALLAAQFENNASGYAGRANAYAGDAEYSASVASSERTAAEAAQAEATRQAGIAETQASAAATSAGEASTSATNAAASAVSSAASATAAGNAQTAAEAAQGLAETAQAAAETAQGLAETAAESVSDSAEQISQNAADISDLKSAVNNFDGYIQQLPSASYSGSPVTINSNDVPVIDEAILTCYPLQAAGVPTPDNPIPIYDYENIVLTQVHNGTQKQYTFPIFDSGGNPAGAAWLAGGVLNTKSGEYSSTYAKKANLNTLSWTLRKTDGDYHLFDWSGNTLQTQGYPDIHNCSNVFQYVDYDQTNYYTRVVPEIVDKTFSVNTNGRIFIWSTKSTVAAFKTWLGEIGAYVVYRKKGASVGGSTTPTVIEVYDGDNTFTLENGTVQLNYKSFANFTDITDFKKYNFRSSFETVKTIAHRGDGTVAPQCTAPAYIAAKKNGAKYAENDLNKSSDGEYVMWHDPTLSRLGTYLKDINGYDMYTDGTLYYWYDSTNDKLYTWDGSDYQESAVQISTLTQCAGANYSVTTLPLAVLKRIDFGAYKGSAFKGTQILTFAEWVLLCKQLGLSCYVDQKAGFTDSVASDIVSIARNLGMLDKMTWLASGHSGTIRTYDPKARVLILSNPTTALIEQYSPLLSGGPVVFGGDVTSLTEEAVHLALTAGFEVEGYYVDVDTSEESQLAFIKTLVGYGVTGLTLDHYFVSDAFEDMVLN